MTRFFRTILALSLLLTSGSRPVWAAWEGTVATSKDSGVDISLVSPVNTVPAHGFMPVWVVIKNRSGAAHSWQITGEQNSYVRSSAIKPSCVQSLQVEKGETARTLLLVPLELLQNNTPHYSDVRLTVDGYGVTNSTALMNSSGMYRPASGGPGTPYVAMGEALANARWASLDKDFRDTSIDLHGSPLNVAFLPTDWRGLSGFDCLWLTEGEYTGRSAEQRAAIRDWVSRGGRLLLCTESFPPALRAELGLPAEVDEGRPGYGYVKLIRWDGKTPPELDVLRPAIQKLDLLSTDDSLADAKDWPMTTETGLVPINAAFLIVFISAFALVIGPLNLFWLADARRRHRLFWTTPLIATAASLLLGLVIVLQDGFGGYGRRSMVTLLLPDQHKALVVQEQMSRTGLLFSGRFTVAEDLAITPVKISSGSPRVYRQAGRTYAGDWFSSHSVQAQRLEAIVPSRAEVQVLNAAEGDASHPPTVVSNIPATLRQLFYTDASGKHWRGENLHTGEKITLQPSHSAGAIDTAGGSQLLSALQFRTQQPGFFRAMTEEGTFIETLPSIHWRQQRAVFIGPVTFAR